MIFNNSFSPDSVINYKMKDSRDLKYCEICKTYKLPRMHHCSQCGSCCMKYDHHCGMVMNCVGVNNYHIFVQFMFLTFLYFMYGAYLNIKYNFKDDLKMEWTYLTWTGLCSLSVLIMQLGSGYYAFTMFTWYCGMAKKNLHAIE
jgi:hypothetical protein